MINVYEALEKSAVTPTIFLNGNFISRTRCFKLNALL